MGLSVESIRSIEQARRVAEETRVKAGKLYSLLPEDVGTMGRYRVRSIGEDPLNRVRFYAVILASGTMEQAEEWGIFSVQPRAVDCLNALNVKFELALAGGNSHEGR